MHDLNILALSGSLRGSSLNTKLIRESLRVLAPSTAVIGDLRLPLYDGDLEDAEGTPASVQRLFDQIDSADGVLISTPEYNGGISGVLKDALDWVSRVKGNPWLEKPVAIMSATAGRSGGARTQYALRLALAPFRPVVVPGPEVMVASASSEFDAAGKLTSERYAAQLEQLMATLRAEIRRRDER